MFVDDDAAIRIATNPGFTQRSKSMRTACHNTRDMTSDGMVKMSLPIEIRNNISDIETKSLSRKLHEKHSSRNFVQNSS